MNASVATLKVPASVPPVTLLGAGDVHAVSGYLEWEEGLRLGRDGDWPSAARAFARATRVAPRDGLYWLNLAHAQRHAGRLQRAVAAARRCLRADPDQVLALRLLSECRLAQHRYVEARDAFVALEAAGAADAETLLQHASALMAMLQFGAATEVLLRALTLKPEMAGAHALLASALRDQGLKREAVECLRTAIALDPTNLEARVQISFEKRHVCDWSEHMQDAADISALLEQAPDNLARVGAVFGMLSMSIEPTLQLKAVRAEARLYGFQVPTLPPVQPVRRAAAAGQRVRLGFLSYDFRQHPVSQLIVELLEGLDRQRFEVFLYSIGPDDGSALRQRVQAAGDHFVDMQSMSEQAAAKCMRADGLEVLVDLMGYTRGARMSILACRPAPLQVAFLGFPGSTGATYIDYLIGDPFVTPLELAPLYSEKLAQMPLTFQPNGRWRPLPQPMSRAEAGLPDDAFVLCAFNHTYKIGPEAFDAWCAVMREVPRAVLWLKETNGQLHDNVRREAQARGVDPQRVIFARSVSYEAHFARLAQADLFVDTWPYNAHTTAADALWAGVPVVTLYQNSFASRVAASVLNAAGMADLAFGTVDEYCRAIVALALEPSLLQGYRQHLEQQRMKLALFDSTQYTHDFGALLQRMWLRWRSGLPAEHLVAQTQAESAI